MSQTNNRGSGKKLISMTKFGLVLILILLAPIASVKIFNAFNAKPNECIDRGEVNSILTQYLNAHKLDLLNLVVNAHSENYSNTQTDKIINNSVWLFRKKLFDTNVPRFFHDQSGQSKKKYINVNLFFSDLQSNLALIDKVEEIKAYKKVNIFFRQILTQNENSGMVAKFGYAVNKANNDSFLPYYQAVFMRKTSEINPEDMEKIITGLGLDWTEIKEIAYSQEATEAVKENNRLAASLGVKQLPAFVLENGVELFGSTGVEVVKYIASDNLSPENSADLELGRSANEDEIDLSSIISESEVQKATYSEHNESNSSPLSEKVASKGNTYETLTSEKAPSSDVQKTSVEDIDTALEPIASTESEELNQEAMIGKLEEIETPPMAPPSKKVASTKAISSNNSSKISLSTQSKPVSGPSAQNAAANQMRQSPQSEKSDNMKKKLNSESKIDSSDNGNKESERPFSLGIDEKFLDEMGN